MKSIVLLGLLSVLSIGTVQAQVKVKPYRAPQTKRGNFGKYPRKVRLAPIVSFGSASANLDINDSLLLISDSAFVDKLANDPNYFSMGDQIKSGSQFGIGLMLDIPFSRNVTFRPRFMYQSKNIGDKTDYVFQDSMTNADLKIEKDNQKRFSQLETMFMLNVNFGSDKKKTRLFIGGGFGFGLNLSATNDYKFHNFAGAYDNPDIVWVDTTYTGSTELGLGGNVYEDFFDKVDFLAQFELGANIGPNFVVLGQYNTSLGNIFTDPRLGTYTPSYYGVALAYILGKKPSLWGY